MTRTLHAKFLSTLGIMQLSETGHRCSLAGSFLTGVLVEFGSIGTSTTHRFCNPYGR